MMKINVILFMVLGLWACKSPKETGNEPVDPAQAAVDQAIAFHGGDAFDSASLQFIFRDRLYKRQRNGGRYQYERIFTNPDDSTEQVRDILTNDGFTREVNGQLSAVEDSMAFKYSNSINSVIYFALLPYRLNDPAVFKKYLGESTLKGKSYHKVQVTFAEEGGGKDFEDVFHYWFDTETHQMDYLAYSYLTDGGGIRFREAFNPRRVGGILFQDFINYKMDKTLPLESADSLFEAGELEKLSEIVLEEVSLVE